MQSKNVNYGWMLLRCLMCFEVLLIHLWPNNDGPKILFPFVMLKTLPVPVFFFLSFYLTKNKFLMKSGDVTRNRVFRLLYPQIVWTVLYFFVYALIGNAVTIKDFLWQLFTGHSSALNPPMWYMIVLLLITIVYFFIFMYFSVDAALCVLCVIFFASVAFEYTGFNERLFGQLRFELRYPLGRFVEMLPYSVLGLFVSFTNVYERLKNRARLFFFILFGFISVFLLKYSVITPAPGFGYSVNNCVLLVFFFAGFAYLFPFEMLPNAILNVIRFCANHTLGIYCAHLLIASVIRKVRLFDGMNGFLFSLLVYFVAFTLCHLASIIPSKFLRSAVD